MSASKDQQVLHTIKDLPADVEQGIMIGMDGVIGNLGGVTLSGASQGESVTICLQGVCEMQVLNANVSADDDEFIEVDANGRAKQFSAGTKAGFALEDGVAAVGGVHALKEVYLYGKKTDPAVHSVLADVDITVNAEDPAGQVDIDLQVVDRDGNDIEEAVDLLFTVYERTMIEALAAEFTASNTGGTLNSTDDQARIWVTTAADGSIQINLTDVSDDRAENIPFSVEILGREAVVPKRIDEATFA